MHNNVKKYADSNDIISLRYVFYDCLDADPSFDKYLEDYEYACKVSGFLEEHVDLTPFSSDQSEWNEDYWISLKKDLKNNFSDKRFDHMKKVAKVVHADRLKRIEDERAMNNSLIKNDEIPLQQVVLQPQQVVPKLHQVATKLQEVKTKSQQVEPQSQKIDISAQQKGISDEIKVNKSSTLEQRPVQEIDNSAYERQKEKEAQERIKKQRDIEEANRKVAEERAREEKLKKVIGIVAIVVVVVLGLIILLTR